MQRKGHQRVRLLSMYCVLITANSLESAFPLWRITYNCINYWSRKAEQARSLSLDLKWGVFPAFCLWICPKSLMTNQSICWFGTGLAGRPSVGDPGILQFSNNG